MNRKKKKKEKLFSLRLLAVNYFRKKSPIVDYFLVIYFGCYYCHHHWFSYPLVYAF